jgi:predicted outer membrane repeat protein
MFTGNHEYIYNATFINCTAQGRGGAVFLQDNENVTFEACRFINNYAKENGGAIYSSNATALIKESTFTNNKADENYGLGGALYLDYGSASIDNVTFENNNATQGGAIYSFSNDYKIMNSKFENNGEDIHTRFDEKGSEITNCGNYTATINDNNFTITLRYNGEEIKLNPQAIVGSATDSYFNLRDQGLVTSVKDQGNMGSCWAFGAAGAFESAFLIATGKTIDISENNIQNLGLRYSIYGKVNSVESGNYYTSTSYFVSWLGAINTTDDTYDELGKISSLSYSPDCYRVLDAAFIYITDKDAIKEFLTKYGAMNIFVYGADPNSQYYNKDTAALYNTK